MIRPFSILDLERLEPHPTSERVPPGNIVEASKFAYTCEWNGEPVFAWGVLCDGVRPGVLQLWMITGARSGPAMLEITRFGLREYLPGLPAKRIEAYVIEGFPEGHRFARLCGFRCETPDGMENFDGVGNRWFQYARV